MLPSASAQYSLATWSDFLQISASLCVVHSVVGTSYRLSSTVTTRLPRGSERQASVGSRPLSRQTLHSTTFVGFANARSVSVLCTRDMTCCHSEMAGFVADSVSTISSGLS